MDVAVEISVKRLGEENKKRWRAIFRHLPIASLILLVLMPLAGCVTAAAKGDRAMELEDYDLALTYYDQAIDEGSRDPEVYYRAALAAQHEGSLAEAERYFSQALRYGGDKHIVRALAEFYISTSNFIQAVRVLQYLLRMEEDVQPIYSNIGTALMYGGKYLDAESYLLLAQQMDPLDPVPYLNLAALYDRHIRNRPRAVSFYQCFVELSEEGNSEERMVKTRLQEISLEGPVDISRVNLECGEVYRIGEPDRLDLNVIFDLEFSGAEMSQESEPMVIVRNEPQDAAVEAEELSEAAGFSEESRETGEERENDAGERGEDLRQRGQDAFEAGHHDRAVEYLVGIPEDQREGFDEWLLGRAYYEMGRFEEASERLEIALEGRTSPEVVERLLVVYARLNREEDARGLCQRFDGWPAYEEALHSCDRWVE